MSRKSFSPEQIIAKLRQIEVLIGQRQSVVGGCRAVGIARAQTNQTHPAKQKDKKECVKLTTFNWSAP